jgi:tungstate transport system ATP-binding protein
MIPTLELRNLKITRGGHTVLNIEELSIQKGEVLTVIGPNGAGKSTLLLTMAGLIKPNSGKIYFQGNELHYRKNLSYRRRIGLVLQNPLLLNSSVIHNVVIGARFRRLQKNERSRRARRWMERFGISQLQKRSARNLSGGEAQRVALARAFAVDPEIVLLDEPFSALDTPTRMMLLEEFQALLADTQMTTVFVTHDMDEALYLGHRVAVILDGHLKQVGSPDHVIASPADSGVAAFVGHDTTITGRVIGSDNGSVVVRVGEHLLEAAGDVNVGRSVLFCVRPEDITLWADNQPPVSSARNSLSGVISRIAPRGALVQTTVDCGFPIRVLITSSSAREMALEPGKNVVLTFKASAVHLIPR